MKMSYQDSYPPEYMKVNVIMRRCTEVTVENRLVLTMWVSEDSWKWVYTDISAHFLVCLNNLWEKSNFIADIDTLRINVY